MLTRKTKERITFNQLRRRFRLQFKVAIPCYREDMHLEYMFSMLRFCASHQDEIRKFNHRK